MIETAVGGRSAGEHLGRLIDGLSLVVQKVHSDPCLSANGSSRGVRESQLRAIFFWNRLWPDRSGSQGRGFGR